MSGAPVQTEKVIGELKDFQRRTVEYVFKRMYLDEDPTHRFLVADEVGLGKTLVARGLIGKTLDHLRHRGVQRIDVVYVCSNAAIAQQNVARLNVFGERHFALATRLTMLPTQLQHLQPDEGSSKINFISLTPGTTFDPKSRGGMKEERAVLYRILRGWLSLPRAGLLNLLQAKAGRESWRWTAEHWEATIDDDLAERFANRVGNDTGLLGRLEEACERFKRYRRGVPSRLPPEETEARYSLIGELRRELSNVCIDALEPDLVILDEFQRFKGLLDGDDDAAVLARRLFDYEDARVLLLSATPYRMLTLNHETDEDHYTDFIRTLQFLFGDRQKEVEALQSDLRRFRQLLYSLDTSAENGLAETRDDIQSRLCSVMARTERLQGAQDQNAMLSEPDLPALLKAQDLHQATLAERTARPLGARDTMEYWKSSPYLLNLMKGYDLKRRLREVLDEPPEEVLRTLRDSRRQLLARSSFERYKNIDPGNARLRALNEATLDAGQWELLWMPPTFPYLEPAGAYARVTSPTKSLVFSSWSVVPDAIAALCSFEAERRMLDKEEDLPRYSELYQKRGSLLRFSLESLDGKDQKHPTGMMVLPLLYPSVALASTIDPLEITMEAGGEYPAPQELALDGAKQAVSDLLHEAGIRPAYGHGPADQRWYWAALSMLDAHHAPEAQRWCGAWEGWRSAGAGHEEEESASAFDEHVKLFSETFFLSSEELGNAPDNLVDVLAEVALASPAVCALRALHRVAPSIELGDWRLLEAAARIADGFRTLFNLPESTALLRASDERVPYWRRVLHHGLEGNLQSVLDEYVHTLLELQGLSNRPEEESADAIADAVAEALSLRTSRTEVDELSANNRSQKIKERRFNVRCRFALRFGEDIRDESGTTLARAGTVRQAFNSPFRPFVLATTSVGQEGLDFHPYCHAVYHWNLPSNPVDLEQREGRVHRYKGHAIRKNVARRFGLAHLQERWRGENPWETLFQLAADDRPPDASDLIPYWIYNVEGGAYAERRVPMLPFSREQSLLQRLKRSLAVYRLVFGQPRQEDLLTHLEDHIESGGRTEDIEKWRISLVPPAADNKQLRKKKA